MHTAGNGTGIEAPVFAPQEANSFICQTLLDRIQEQCTHLAVSRTKPVKTVHQLRVDIRRTLSALRIFEEQLPGPEIVWFRRILKRIRKRSNAVRDLDVLTKRLVNIQSRQRNDKQAQRSLQKAVRRLRSQRPNKFKLLRRQIENTLRAKNFPRHKAKLLRQDAQTVSIRSDPRLGGGSVEQLPSQHQLTAICDVFLRSTDFRMDDLNSIHRFRLQSKNLRYTIEILTPFLPSSVVDDLLPILSQLQQSLGRINDFRFARARLANLARKFEGGDARYLKRLSKEFRSKLQASLNSLQTLWTPEFVQRLHQLVHSLKVLHEKVQHSGSETEDKEESAEIRYGRQDGP